MQRNYLGCPRRWNLTSRERQVYDVQVITAPLRRGSCVDGLIFQDFTVFQNLTPDSRYRLPIHTTTRAGSESGIEEVHSTLNFCKSYEKVLFYFFYLVMV